MDSRPPCHYCKNGYEEVGGSDVELVWHCTRCGTTASAERVHNVYDAAMAWHTAIDRRTRMAFEYDTPQNEIKMAELEIDKYEMQLVYACRKAEEVERG